MAIYHTRVKTFSRAQGHASTAAAAYRAGLLIIDQKTGTKHDYRRRGGVVETRCVVPDHAPDWSLDPRLLWPAAEDAERRKDATVAREFEIALPHELDDPQRSELTASIARSLVKRYGFAVMASIHEPQTADGLNHHAHLLATTRRMGPEGLSAKTRELDGGPSGRGEVEWIREMVARLINDKLAAAGIDGRVDHRSLKDQAQSALERGDMDAAMELSRAPTRHVGKNATALHRRGIVSDHVADNQGIADENAATLAISLAQLGELAAQPIARQPASHADADEQFAADGFLLPDALASGPAESKIWFDPSMIGAERPTASRRDDPAVATRAQMAEATVLWGDGFFKTISISFKATSILLRDQADRIAMYVHSALFRSDVRQLLDLVKQVKRDASRFKRRLTAEDRAQHALTEAELLLERFDSEHAGPGSLTRQEWSRRRARRLRAVQVCQERFREARTATNPDAQARYEATARASGEALEQWSERMLGRYPVDLAADAPEEHRSTPPSNDQANAAADTGRPVARPKLH